MCTNFEKLLFFNLFYIISVKCIILFQNHLFKYFYLEPESQVQSEALDLLKVIFDHHVIPKTIEEQIYDCISYAVLEDCHKVVKLKALSFWDLVIQKELEHEGMIDGTFPTVTFSKVLKKIITFDDATVEKCILRVLHRLNEIGGLNVLLYIFENANDEELINPAIKYITKIADVLTEYNITSLHCDSSFPLSSSSSFNTEVLPDEFINELLHLERKSLGMYPQSSITYSRRNKIDFLDFLKTFDSFCKKRAKKASKDDDLETVLDRIFVN